MRFQIHSSILALTLAFGTIGCTSARWVEYERIVHYDANGRVTGFSEVERVTGPDQVFIKARPVGGIAPRMFEWCDDSFGIACYGETQGPWARRKTADGARK
jgi:hypothetical protein